MTRVAVLGAGAWGTAYGKVLADAGNEVRLWARRPEVVAAVRDRHENPDYLPGVRLPATLSATDDAGRCVRGRDMVVLALPSEQVRPVLAAVVAGLRDDVLLVSLTKGIEPGTSLRMSEVVLAATGLPADRVAVVTGPNLAGEIAAGHPAATVVASTSPATAARLQQASRTPYFRPYTNGDVIGCELGGAVKNVIALAAGMAEGMGFGDNTKASLITRGLAETSRLGVALGADPVTFAGLAGLGDLVATCMSRLSRNRTLGERLGRGETLAQVRDGPHVTAEGVTTCLSVLDLAGRAGVDMPIAGHVAAVLSGAMTPAQMVRALMSRSSRGE